MRAVGFLVLLLAIGGHGLRSNGPQISYDRETLIANFGVDCNDLYASSHFESLILCNRPELVRLSSENIWTLVSARSLYAPGRLLLELALEFSEHAMLSALELQPFTLFGQSHASAYINELGIDCVQRTSVAPAHFLTIAMICGDGLNTIRTMIDGMAPDGFPVVYSDRLGRSIADFAILLDNRVASSLLTHYQQSPNPRLLRNVELMSTIPRLQDPHPSPVSVATSLDEDDEYAHDFNIPRLSSNSSPDSRGRSYSGEYDPADVMGAIWNSGNQPPPQ